MEVARLGECGGVLEGVLEVAPELDQLDAERAHRCVLLDAVAARDDDGRGNAEAPRCPWDPLAGIPPPRGDNPPHPGLPAAKPPKEGEPAGQLERADRPVGLVLQPDSPPAALAG